MAKDLVLDVVARKNSKDLELLAAEFDKLAHSANDMNTTLQKSTTFSNFLEQQIAKTKVQVKQLGDEFARTGKADVFASLKGAEKNLKSLEGISKQLAKSVATGIQDGGREGFKVASADTQGFLSNPQIGPTLTSAIVGGLIIGAPAIGAALDAALLGGVGLGGIGLGIVGQLKDPAVQNAFTHLKDTATGVLSQSTKAFGPVLVDTAHDFQDVLLKAEPVLEKAFDKLAPHAEKVFQGLEGLFEKASPGLLKALDTAGPILDELGKDLPGLGAAFTKFFDSISQGAGGARDGLHSFFTVLDAGITGTGYFVETLSKGYEGLVAFGDLLTGDTGSATARFNEVINGAAGGEESFARGLAKAALAAGKTTTELVKLNGQLDALITKQLDVSGANDAFQKGLNDLGQALNQNNHSLVGNSDAAIQNREAIRQLIAEAQKARDKQIEMAGGANASKAAIDAANSSYDQAIKKIEDVGVKAGLSKKDLDELAGNYQINVLLAIDAVLNSGLAQNVAPHDPGRYGSAGPPSRRGGPQKRASGGPVTAGVPYWVGENGPELMVPATNGQIIPKLPAPVSFVASSAARGSAGGPTVTFAGDTNSAFATAFMNLVRTGAIQIH